MLKRFSCLILTLALLNSILPYAWAESMMVEYLCQLGVKFHEQGRQDMALDEFHKALLVNPDSQLAKQYIQMLEGGTPVEETSVVKPQLQPESSVSSPPVIKPTTPKPSVFRQEKISPKKTVILPPPEQVTAPKIKKSSVLPPPSEVVSPAFPVKTSAKYTIELGDSFKNITQPIEIEQGNALNIAGRGIERFLVTQPDIITVQRKDSNTLLVRGENLGYTYLHIWDSQGRWTVEIMTMPKKAAGPTVEEENLLEEKRAGNFRLRYNVEWSSFETGRRFDRSLKRTSYSWGHAFNLDGETPYGLFDSGLSLSTSQTTTDVTYFSMGLTKGKLWGFNDFSLHGFDVSPGISNIVFSGANLRGVNFSSPAFNNKINYTTFWGREGGGRYAGLSPGLGKLNNSFLSGFDLKFTPTKNQLYEGSVFQGSGRDRPVDLNRYGYDFKGENNLEKWKLGYEVGFDSDTFAYLLKSNYGFTHASLSNEFRCSAVSFKSMTGMGWRQGEIGMLTNFDYNPTEKLSISTRLDVFRDRLFASPDNLNRLNEDLSTNASYQINPLTSVRADYSLLNDLGRVAGFRSHNAGLGLYRGFDWIRRVNTYISYRYNYNQYFSSPAMSYYSNKLYGGIRFNLIDNLNYFFDQEYSWAKGLITDETSSPQAYQTGLDWQGRISKTPFYLSLRSMYRDEEDSLSTFSFLSGEDYLDSFGELTYRPKPDTEIYANMRVRNVWADNPDVTKRVDANFYAGMRYSWDTGLRWDPVGVIQGMVFKDTNGDGLRQRDEAPVHNVKILLGKKKSAVTDVFGCYSFHKIRARKITVSIDNDSLPRGYSLTGPAVQEVSITNGKITEINFGIASRTEVSGYVFQDIDGDGKIGSSEKGIGNVVLVLEDGSKAKTDSSGRYYFKAPKLGKHTLRLDIATLPAQYIPLVPIYKEVEISEGAIYQHNIPVRKTE